MNKIGFKNFRRFQNLPLLDYSGITFLVGRNNAGKSTLVKALLLIDNYFKSSNFMQLTFGNNVLEDANIVTYGRAKYATAVDNQIDFDFQFDNYMVLLSVTGDNDKSFANIISLIMHDTATGFVFAFDMLNKSLKIGMEYVSKSGNSNEALIQELEGLISDINTQLNIPELKKTSKEYIELITEKEKLEGKINELNPSHNANNNSYQLEGEFGSATSLSEIVTDLINYSQSEYSRIFNNIQSGEETPEGFEDLKAFNDYGMRNIADGVFEPFISFLQTSSTIYLSANPTKQSALFAIRDKSNALAQAINDYKQLNILDGEEEQRFVLDWMKAFDVGDNFKIEMYSGEAYEMKINSKSGNIHLADKGMGSIQAMALIMKIACAIRRHNSNKKHREVYGLKEYKTIIIEEPELNLHPALQSILAELFLKVYLEYGINFIIETHSEYLIRTTQFLVKDNDFEIAPNDNPFCVIYFDDVKGPYKMNYREDGKFIEEFGSGFFDETRRIVKKMI